MLAQTRYAPADGGAIAYQRFGDGPIEVVIANGFPGHVELGWEQPGMARLRRRLATFATVTAFDRRGVGLSDPSPPDDPPRHAPRTWCACSTTWAPTGPAS